MRVELVRDRQLWVEREGALEGLLGAGFGVRRSLHVLSDHAVATAEPRPCGSEARIELDALFVQLTRARKIGIRPLCLVRAEIHLVRARVVWRFGGRRQWGAGQRKRKRLHDAARDVVLQLK